MGSPRTGPGSIAIPFTENLLQVVNYGTTRCGILGKRALSFHKVKCRIAGTDTSRYERKYTGSDPRKIKYIQHIAKAGGRATPSRPDEETRRAKCPRDSLCRDSLHPVQRRHGALFNGVHPDV